ncbi:MAG TPA: PIN domain-containing protein, partial [Dehalococcoidia bacterium]|nr:PIN domain-containing protein [Dehalococcoidia bacterium]
MTKALLDINLVLDYVLLRVPFAQDAITIWDALQRGTFAGFVSAITAPTIFYVVRRQSGISSARKAIQHILTALHTCPVDHAVLHHALSLPFAD